MLKFFKNLTRRIRSLLSEKTNSHSRWRDSGRRSMYGDYRILEYKTRDGKIIEEYEDVF